MRFNFYHDHSILRPNDVKLQYAIHVCSRRVEILAIVAKRLPFCSHTHLITTSRVILFLKPRICRFFFQKSDWSPNIIFNNSLALVLSTFIRNHITSTLRKYSIVCLVDKVINNTFIHNTLYRHCSLYPRFKCYASSSFSDSHNKKKMYILYSLYTNRTHLSSNGYINMYKMYMWNLWPFKRKLLNIVFW